MLALALLLALDGIYCAIQLPARLYSARSSLARAEAEFGKGHLAVAQAALESAEDAAGDAHGLRWHPATAIGRVLPWVGTDLQAVDHLSDAARLAASAGLELVEGLERGRAGRSKISEAIYSNGRVHFDVIDQIAPYISSASDRLAEARAILDEAPAPHVQAVADALEDARRRLATGARSAQRGRAVLAALPDMLGRDSPKRYFLAFQSPSEERATGGLLGFYGILHADGGEIRLVHVGSIGELEARLTGRPSAPAWFKREYEDFAALKTWRQTNLSPNFPVVSQVWSEMYTKSGGEPVDGVIAMDPHALADLMAGTGPVEVDGMEITAANVEQVLLHDSYELEQKTQNLFVAAIIGKVWGRFQSADVRPAPLVGGLSEAVATGHFKMYSSDVPTQSALTDLGADGSVDALGNVQFVYHNAIGANKVDYFLSRSIETNAQIDASGNLAATTTVTMKNDAPSGPASILLGGHGANAPPGENQMIFNVLLPKAADVKDFEYNGRRSRPFHGTDADNQRIWDVVFIKPGKTVTLSVSYVIPAVVDLGSAPESFSLAFVPQPSVTPDSFDFTIEPPEGYSISTDSEGLTLERESLVARLDLDRAQQWVFRVSKDS